MVIRPPWCTDAMIRYLDMLAHYYTPDDDSKEIFIEQIMREFNVEYSRAKCVVEYWIYQVKQ